MKVKLPILLAFITLLASCNEYKIARQLENFRKETITFPDDLIKIKGESIGMSGEFHGGMTLVLYYDSLSCSTCQIGHLHELTHLYEFSDSSGVSVISIFSPSPEEYETVVREVQIRNFPYPIYIDGTGSFRRNNRGIPSDNRFHCFLLDSEGRPFFVGNPTASSQLWNLYTESIMHMKGSNSYKNPIGLKL